MCMITGRCREAATCRYCFYLVAKDQHFAPSGKTMNWVEKWLVPFLMGTTSSTAMQRLGEIEQRAPAVGAKNMVFVTVFRLSRSDILTTCSLEGT